MIIRLYVKDKLSANQSLDLSVAHSHYLTNVLKVSKATEVFVFNGQDGEFLAKVQTIDKKQVILELIQKVFAAEPLPNTYLAFAPVKRDAIDLIAEKATELGAGHFCPIITARTIAGKVNLERMSKIAIEAAEQSRRINVPDFSIPQKLKIFVQNWVKDNEPNKAPLFFFDETGQGGKALETMQKYKNSADIDKVGFLIGPEGGFSDDELDFLRQTKEAIGVTLDKHILKTETACFAALTLWKYL